MSAVWVTVTSLIGVVIGGALSRTSQRFAERSASRRHAASMLEGRRGERLAYLMAFIQTAQEVERLAIKLHQHGASGDEFMERTEATLDQLWVNLRAVQIVCSHQVSEAARVLAGEAHTVVREGPGDQKVTPCLRPSRMNLIIVARIDLEEMPANDATRARSH